MVELAILNKPFEQILDMLLNAGQDHLLDLVINAPHLLSHKWDHNLLDLRGQNAFTVAQIKALLNPLDHGFFVLALLLLLIHHLGQLVHFEPKLLVLLGVVSEEVEGLLLLLVALLFGGGRALFRIGLLNLLLVGFSLLLRLL